MKKLSLILIMLTILTASAFAVDSVVVKRNNKAVRTSAPVFNSVTVTTLNYNVLGTVTANKLASATAVLTGTLTGKAASLTTVNITNLVLPTKITVPQVRSYSSVTGNRTVTININNTNYRLMLMSI